MTSPEWVASTLVRDIAHRARLAASVAYWFNYGIGPDTIGAELDELVDLSALPNELRARAWRQFDPAALLAAVNVELGLDGLQVRWDAQRMVFCVTACEPEPSEAAKSEGVYLFELVYPRFGSIVGVFCATSDEVKSVIGKRFDLGEALGKHSCIDGTLTDDDVTLVSDAPDDVKAFRRMFPEGIGCDILGNVQLCEDNAANEGEAEAEEESDE